MNGKPERELTREERREVKKRVVSMCANYDREYGCLPLDYCKYNFLIWATFWAIFRNFDG